MSAQSRPGMAPAAQGAQAPARESSQGAQPIPQTKRRGGRPPGSVDTTRLAFLDLLPKSRHEGGRPNQLELVTVAQVKDCLRSIQAGVTPWVAISRFLEVPARTYQRWRQERDEQEDPIGVHPNPITDKFLRMVDAAFAAARGDAERRVLKDSPLDALTKGPLGRTAPDRPGWTGDQSQAIGPIIVPSMQFQFIVTNNGGKTIPAEVVPPAELGTGE